MSKHRRRSSNNDYNNSFNGGNQGNGFDMSQLGGLFNNMDPNMLNGLFNNVDMNQLSSILSGMGGNMRGNTNGNTNASNNNISPNAAQPAGDRRIDLLNAIKPLVDAERSNFIDTVIQLYAISKIIKR